MGRIRPRKHPKKNMLQLNKYLKNCWFRGVQLLEWLSNSTNLGL